jgi:DNA-binding MarR family transcriptional regulator
VLSGSEQGRFARAAGALEHVHAEIHEEMRLHAVAGDVLDQAVADHFGINRTDLRCLDIIRRRGRVAAGRLASESGLSTGAVTTVLDRLERAGLARRVADPADRRRVLAELTEKARAETAELYAPLGDALRVQRAGLETDDALVVRDFLREARRLTEAHAGRMRAQSGGAHDGEASYRSARSSSRSASESMRTNR